MSVSFCKCSYVGVCAKLTRASPSLHIRESNWLLFSAWCSSMFDKWRKCRALRYRHIGMHVRILHAAEWIPRVFALAQVTTRQSFLNLFLSLFPFHQLANSISLHCWSLIIRATKRSPTSPSMATFISPKVQSKIVRCLSLQANCEWDMLSASAFETMAATFPTHSQILWCHCGFSIS